MVMPTGLGAQRKYTIQTKLKAKVEKRLLWSIFQANNWASLTVGVIYEHW